MKYIFLIIMLLPFAFLACSPSPKAGVEKSPEDNNVNYEAAAEQEYIKGTWIENWNQAIAAAKKLNRPIMINFTGSDWCPWCFRLRDEVFVMDAFKEYAENNLVLLTVDFPRGGKQSEELKNQNQTLQRQFGIQGYPTILLVDKDGKEINRTGYQAGGAQNYIEHITELLGK